MLTGATLFTGGGGVDIGMLAAGITPAYGLEYDAEIAEVAHANGFPVTVADILDIDPASMPQADFLHASPPCPNFSVAKRDRSETPRDIAMARQVAAIVTTTRPRFFTLENVTAYARSESFQIIVTALAAAGYMLRWQNINAANFDVPQTRRRLWLRAVREGLLPELPVPEPWVGWYTAIEDLLPGLPESGFAPWQLKRLPEIYKSLLVGAGGYNDTVVTAQVDTPSFTVTGNENQGNRVRAFLVPGGNASSFAVRGDDEPARTVGDTERVGNISRAWLDKGRVVQLTVRCLARLQTFPDWYALPDNKALACKIIGNAVPPLLYEKLVRQLILQ